MNNNIKNMIILFNYRCDGHAFQLIPILKVWPDESYTDRPNKDKVVTKLLFHCQSLNGNSQCPCKSKSDDKLALKINTKLYIF